MKQELLTNEDLQGKKSGAYCENELLREKKGKWILCRKQEDKQM